MIDIKSLFEKFSNANFFSRVDNIHILELHIGLDEKGPTGVPAICALNSSIRFF